MNDKLTLAGSPTMSKRDIKKLAENYDLSSLSENPAEAYAFLMRVEAIAKELKKVVGAAALANLPDDGINVLNGTLTAAGGGVRFSGEACFGHFTPWRDAVERVKEIEGLMKSAWKHKGNIIIDEETGEEVPAAKPATANAYLKYTF
jgi:hypothetical protein